MRLKPDTFALTLLVGVLHAIGPLSVDTYLASLPFMATELNVSGDLVQLTLSSYLVGFSLGQIFFGPISDKYGRKPVILFGLALYFVCSVICAITSDIWVLIFARGFQAFAASSPIILSRALVRDLYEGPRAAREMSILTSVSGLAPVLAPILGGFLQTAFGWRSVFVTLAASGLGLLALVAFLLPETIRKRQEGPLSFASVFRSFGIIWANRAFRINVGIQACGYTGLFLFISGSPFVLQRLYGFSPIEFSLMFAISSMSFLAGTFVNRRLIPKFGVSGTIGIGTACLALGGWLTSLGILLMPQSPFAFAIPTMAFFHGIGLILPLAVASALAPFPDRAGAASSLMGLLQMVCAALMGSWISTQIETSALPLGLALAAVGTIALAIYWFTRPRAT
jgi:DHA1 family bicyclomycin/chloramphenicol resistance-like MFS transporter